jgi:hypothetical protein
VGFEVVHLRSVTKSVLLVTALRRFAASRKRPSSGPFRVLKGRGLPPAGGSGTENETSFVFWGDQRPAGTAFGRLRRGPKVGLNPREKAITGRRFGRGRVGGRRRGWRGRARDAEGGSRAARQDAAPGVGGGGRGASKSTRQFGAAQRSQAAGPYLGGGPRTVQATSLEMRLGGGPGRCPPLVCISRRLCKGAARRRGVAAGGVRRRRLLGIPARGGRGSRPRRSQGRAAPGPEGGGKPRYSYARCGARGRGKSRWAGGREIGWARGRNGGRSVTAGRSLRRVPPGLIDRTVPSAPRLSDERVGAVWRSVAEPSCGGTLPSTRRLRRQGVPGVVRVGAASARHSRAQEAGGRFCQRMESAALRG